MNTSMLRGERCKCTYALQGSLVQSTHSRNTSSLTGNCHLRVLRTIAGGWGRLTHGALQAQLLLLLLVLLLLLLLLHMKLQELVGDVAGTRLLPTPKHVGPAPSKQTRRGVAPWTGRCGGSVVGGKGRATSPGPCASPSSSHRGARLHLLLGVRGHPSRGAGRVGSLHNTR